MSSDTEGPLSSDAGGRDGDGAVRPRPALLSVVIPAYNEAERLPKLIEELRAVLDPLADEYEIIVVDDGSNDDTLDILEAEAMAKPKAAKDAKGEADTKDSDKRRRSTKRQKKQSGFKGRASDGKPRNIPRRGAV